MSLLHQVISSLKANPDIKFFSQAGSYEGVAHHTRDASDPYDHLVRVFVVPKHGRRTIDELRELVEALTPGLTPTEMRNFELDKETGQVCFAILTFVEDIGVATCQRAITLTDNEARKAFNHAPQAHTVALKRAIVVYIFPSKRIRKEVMSGRRNGWGMSLDEFIHYRVEESNRAKPEDPVGS